MDSRTLIERFLSHVDYADDGCWRWTGSRQSGYGRFSIEREGKQRVVSAHRWYYEQVVGPIPKGLTLDHLCHGPDCPGGLRCLHRRCVNPDHLEPVTHRENLLRHKHAVERTEEQCRYGHEMTEENTLRVEVTQHGKRVMKERCRTCHRDRAREYGRRKAAHDKIDKQRSILSEGKGEFWI